MLVVRNPIIFLRCKCSEVASIDMEDEENDDLEVFVALHLDHLRDDEYFEVIEPSDGEYSIN